MINADSITYVIFFKDNIVDNRSHSQVVCTPGQLTADELRECTCLMTVNDIIHEYSVSEAEKLEQILHPPPTDVFLPVKLSENQYLDPAIPDRASNQPETE